MAEILNFPSGEISEREEEEEGEAIGNLVFALIGTAQLKNMPITTLDITGPITVEGKGDFGLHINPAKVYDNGGLKTFTMDLYDDGEHSCQWVAEISWDEEGLLDSADITVDPIIGRIKLTITEVSTAAVEMIKSSIAKDMDSEIPHGMVFPFPMDIIRPTRPN